MVATIIQNPTACLHHSLGSESPLIDAAPFGARSTADELETALFHSSDPREALVHPGPHPIVGKEPLNSLLSQ